MRRQRDSRITALRRIALTLFVATACPAAITASDERAPRWNVAISFDIDSPPIVDGRAIIASQVNGGGGIAALDAETGAVIWQANDLAGPAAAGSIVYADRVSSPGMTDGSSLTARDVLTGHELWSRPGAGGLLAADDTGVVTGHGNGIARYAADGTKRWGIRDFGGFPRRIVTNDRYVLDLTSHSGARIAFEVQTIERLTGKQIGSAGLTDLLAVDAQTVYGTSDEFGDDPDLQCGSAEIVTALLGAVEPAPPDQSPILEQRLTDYVLDDLAEPTPPPVGKTSNWTSPCRDEGADRPRVIVSERHVILASGSVLGVFDRVDPRRYAPTTTPFARFRDATFVGGPYAGKIYVKRPRGLFAMTIGDRHETRFDRLIVRNATTFAVAGLKDRSYASDGKTTIAFDANTLVTRATYRLGCARLRAVVRTDRADVVECDRGDGIGLIAALSL